MGDAPWNLRLAVRHLFRGDEMTLSPEVMSAMESLRGDVWHFEFGQVEVSAGALQIVLAALDQNNETCDLCQRAVPDGAVAVFCGACEDRLRADLDRAETIAAPSAVAVAGPLARSLADFERSCLVHIEEEQQRPNPDNSLIAVLCDAVRLTRECAEDQTIAAMAGTPAPPMETGTSTTGAGCGCHGTCGLARAALEDHGYGECPNCGHASACHAEARS
jgi:hypothetical protein